MKASCVLPECLPNNSFERVSVHGPLGEALWHKNTETGGLIAGNGMKHESL